MRTLASALTQAQKDMGEMLCQIVLTSGTASYTYDQASANVLYKVTHTEQPYSQKAQVLVDNSDGALTSLSLEGYQGVFSYGYNTGAGTADYSACAPLKVKAQELLSTQGMLTCLLDLYGIPDQLAQDEASEAYPLTPDDTRTVKGLINAIAGTALACYSHTTAYTVDWDSEDSLIDTFKPADSFRINKGETRLAKIKELLGYTKCVMLIKADGDIHIINPTVSGTTYDYEYNDAELSTNHTFFSKVYRNRLILPNKVDVSSPSTHSSLYTGSATSAASFALLPKTHFVTTRLASNTQATAIATAMIQRLEVDHERGNGLVPMNVGQEVYDYLKITDAREGDNRTGNIGYIIRTYDPTQRLAFNMQFGFGDILLGSLIGTGQGLVTTEQTYVTRGEFEDRIRAIYVNTDGLYARINALYDYLIPGNNVWFKALTVEDYLRIPHEAA